MRAYEIILKKRDGGALSKEELEFFIKGYVDGNIPDYQAAALVMAIYFRGMDTRETVDLTMAMVNSGERVDLSGIKGIKVDKHSTGGVGDKTTIALAPWVAAAGAPVAKMAGRGLGHTGGTIDKLESIPGFRTAMGIKEFVDSVNETGIAIAAQTADIAPADKKLYALRDATAAADSMPLIAASIMSKKIASGADAIILDVKVGRGAFMKTPAEALKLARTMVDIGLAAGKKTTALITRMDQPLGFAVGNAPEVKEAIDVLKGGGPSDLRELCLVLGAHMLVLAGAASDIGEGKGIMLNVLENGSALRKFKEMVENQGGNPAVADDYSLFPQAVHLHEVKAASDGFVRAIDAQEIGLASMMLGAGRETKNDAVDPAAGVVLCKKAGDRVKEGEILAVLHTNRQGALREAEARVLKAYVIGNERPEPVPLVIETVM